MSIDLVVNTGISETNLSPISDQKGAVSGFSIAKVATKVDGLDTVGSSLPLSVSSGPTSEQFKNGETWGRLIRLDSTAGFYDLGIDEKGNLFINSSSSTASNHVLTISPKGEIFFNPSGIQIASGPTVDLVIDKTTGQLCRQS